ncbi:WD40 domain-containing protein [Phlyctema vagabunda]|uniref:WD40 domain-containing protein n=1 Tax=Phlyctema vagabunda TaxID=108571 RepID=A0ABR4P3Z4_9HELO
MVLNHPISIKPAEKLEIWNEQVGASPNSRRFIQASQVACPPAAAPSPNADSNPKTGTTLMSFDKSGTILASRIEDMPTSVWIWDMDTKALRSLVIFHAPIARLYWHPSIPELLMVRCEGEENKAVAHLWKASWGTPKIINFKNHLPGGKIIGKSIIRWLNVEAKSPVLFFSDSQDFLLASISEPGDQEKLPWESPSTRDVSMSSKPDESSFNFTGMDENMSVQQGNIDVSMGDEDTMMGISDGSEGSEGADDTFQFRKFVEPRGS